MKIFLNTLVIVFFSTSLLAQLSDFKLNSYIHPDVSFQAIDTRFGLSGYSTTSQYSSIIKESKFGFTPSVTYRNHQISRRYIGVHTVGLNINPDFTWGENSSGKFSNQNYFGKFTAESVNQFYIRPKFFLETDFSGFTNSTTEFNDDASNSTIRSNNTSLNIDIPLMVGFGRIENVSPNWDALRVFEVLERSAKLKGTIDIEMLHDLSDLVAQRDFVRFFDYRLKKIEDLEEVDAFLRSNDLINEYDMVYFSLLNDIWDYGRSDLRLSGHNLKFGIEPTFNYYLNFREQKNVPSLYEQRQRIYGLNALVQYILHRPYKQKWQFDYVFGFRYGLEKNILFGNETSQVVASPDLNCSATYYFNTRSRFRSGFYASYRSHINGEKDNSFQVRPNADIQYYISPQTRLALNLSYSIYEQNLNVFNQERSNFNYGLTLNHAFF